MKIYKKSAIENSDTIIKNLNNIDKDINKVYLFLSKKKNELYTRSDRSALQIEEILPLLQNASNNIKEVIKISNEIR